MNVVLFDDPVIRGQLLPLTFTRPVATLRVGILTIAEKWKARLSADVSFATQSYLAGKFSHTITSDNYWINGALCPDDAFVAVLRILKPNDAIEKNGRILAVRTADDEVPEVIAGTVHSYPSDVALIDQPWKIFQQNGPQLRADFEMITKGRTSHPVIDKPTVVYNAANVFLEEGVSIKAAILNAEIGPIYLGKNSQVQEGAIIRGPFSLGEGSIVSMGGKMRGDTSIGHNCKVGGEVANSVVYGFSNKSHEGYLGNSVIGEWCNLGADTNTSNMKNNYDVVKLWSHVKKDFISTGLYFCGLIMGDHSKAGINTMFNTGSMVGVNSNVLGGGYPPNFIPSFSWAGENTYDIEKALATAERAMGRRNQKITDADKSILREVFAMTAQERNWEKKRS
ncbi:MAG TPA: GlmU family protein [Cyclobacteriaceae bacterium]|nr:GlmU family protein [Cyclobacteriaceae bacterium]